MNTPEFEQTVKFLKDNDLGEIINEENIERFEIKQTEYERSTEIQFFYGECSDNFILTIVQYKDEKIQYFIEWCGYKLDVCKELSELKEKILYWTA